MNLTPFPSKSAPGLQFRVFFVGRRQEWLWERRYRLWWHTPPLFNPANFFANAHDVYPQVVSINMLCIPREAEIPVNGLREIVENRHPLEGAPVRA